MLETLEDRRLFSVDTSSVGLFLPGGGPANVDPHKRIWIIVHGLSGSHSDNDLMGAAIQAQDPTSQVLNVDWSALASQNVANTVRKQLDNAWATADWIAARIKAAGIPASRINLVGFSMGGQVEDRLAKDLMKRTAQVNRIIAIDPSAPHIDAHTRQIPTFADESAYSIAFSGGDNAAFYKGALSCDDAILLTGLPADDMTRHVSTVEVVTSMFRRSAGFESSPTDHASSIFSVQNILGGHLPAWQHDVYGFGYEATMSCAASGDPWPIEYGPQLLTYLNRRGHTMHS